MSIENIYHYDPPHESPYGQAMLGPTTFQILFNIYRKIGMLIFKLYEPDRADEISKYIEDTKNHFQKDSPFINGFKYTFAGMDPTQLNPKVSVPICGQLALKIMITIRIIKEIELTPEIQTKELKQPVFVIGLPRSGTTFLHHLLACGEKARTIPLYQQFFPGNKTMSLASRKKITNFIIQFLNTNSDDLPSFHVMKVDDPDEDYFLMEMMGASFPQCCAVPRYEDYRKNFFSIDWQYIYDKLRDIFRLDMIENDVKDDEYLCLKNVQHIAYMKYLLQTFPDGKFIWIHRDVWSNYKSCLHIYKQTQKMCPSDVGMGDDDWLNKNSLYMTKLCLQNAIHVRDAWVAENPERSKQIMDISFKELTKNPYETVKQIHEHFDLPFGEETQTKLKKILDHGNVRKKTGMSTIQNDVFTVTEQDVREQLKDYSERFADMF